MAEVKRSLGYRFELAAGICAMRRANRSRETGVFYTVRRREVAS